MLEERFTTTEVARFCGVNVTTIRRWVDGGKLKAMRTPGKHSRILKRDLVNFLNLYNIPIPVPLQKTLEIVIIGKESSMLRALEEECKKQFPDYRIHYCSNPYEGLIVVIVDSLKSGIDAVSMCKAIEGSLQNTSVKIIAFFASPSTQIQKKMTKAGIDTFLFWPVKAEALREAIIGY